MELREERLNDAVVIGRSDIFLRLLWLKDIYCNTRKKFKDNLMNEFHGKIVIDFRRQGGAVVMNDVFEEDIDLANLTEEIIAAHERSGRRGGTVSHIAENKFKLFDADPLKGNLTISTYDSIQFNILRHIFLQKCWRPVG